MPSAGSDEDQLIKDIAVEFLNMVVAGKIRDAYAKHIGPGFRHHNAFFMGDAISLLAAMEENAAASPHKTLDIKRVLQDGDLVAIHSHVRQSPTDRGAAVVHIFRFNDNLIAEVWDVGQAVPEKSPNEFGMF